MKYANQPYLAKGVAGFIALQLDQLNWPLPDIIIPVPISLMRWMQRGYNQSDLLAKQLGKLVDRPVLNALKRTSGGFHQAGLNRQQRLQLNPHSFQLAKNVCIEDKCILLVDDVTTTGSTFRCCGEALLEGCPESIYGLAVCQTV